MKILVLNAGSSSLKYSVFENEDLDLIAKGLVEKIGDANGGISHKFLKEDQWSKIELQQDIKDHKSGLELVVDLLTHVDYGVIDDIVDIEKVGHRVVHGGEHFSAPSLVNEELKRRVKELIPLAPLHNPANLMGIEVSEHVFPNAQQVAVFDTAFHQTLPDYAYRYAVPEKLYDQFGIRVYGMHGTSHQYVAIQAAEHLKKPLADCNLITVHLGNGCSMSAIHQGKCVDTSLGLSPLPGLVMGTRSGDIDPAVIFQLIREHNYTYQEVENLLNKESGLKGLSGYSDMRDIEERKARGDDKAKLALEVYTYRIKKYVGAYLAAVGPTDAIIFTAGVGENASYIRSMSLEGLEHLGVEVDENKNSQKMDGLAEIHASTSNTKILVIPTDEEKQIALSTIRL